MLTELDELERSTTIQRPKKRKVKEGQETLQLAESVRRNAMHGLKDKQSKFTFYPTALKGCRGIVFTHDVRMGGRREIVCPGCISETVRCRKFILGRDIGWGCRCAPSWPDLDLTFDLAVVTLSLKILSGLYLGNRKV